MHVDFSYSVKSESITYIITIIQYLTGIIFVNRESPIRACSYGVYLHLPAIAIAISDSVMSLLIILSIESGVKTVEAGEILFQPPPQCYHYHKRW